MKNEIERNIYIIDSYAIIKLIKKEVGFEKVEYIFKQAEDNNAQLFMSSINFGEALYRLTQIKGYDYFEAINQNLQSLPFKIVDTDIKDVIQAANFKSKGGISYADCFAVNLAHLKNGTILTGDREFKQFEDFIKIEWI